VIYNLHQTNFAKTTGNFDQRVIINTPWAID